MRWLFLFALIGCAPVRDGTTSWQAGELEQATTAWTSGGGSPSAAVHYNLGVAAYRAEELPLAVAHWRAARRLKPRDGDVVHNLAHVRGDLSGVSAPVGEPLSWMEFATPVELGLIGIALVGWASFGLVARRRRRKGTLAPWLLLGATGAGVGLAGVHGAISWTRAPVFVLQTDVVLRDGPDSSGQELGQLGAGSEVALVAAAGPWVRVADGASRTGWVPAGAGLVVGPVPAGNARLAGLADVAVPAEPAASEKP
ncbi:MAG: SH3 domain-containing protein [Proteobacteria bacterium]|nr:SH3 domain-containing protein [Pseudomonadota bacterium]